VEEEDGEIPEDRSMSPLPPLTLLPHFELEELEAPAMPAIPQPESAAPSGRVGRTTLFSVEEREHLVELFNNGI
jgi:hypothetical protein